MLSDIKIWPVKTASKFKANGVVTFHETVKVQFKVVEGAKGLFVSFPQEKYEKDGKTEYKNQVDFVSLEVKNDVSSKLIAAYNKQVNGGAGEESQIPIEQPKTSKASKNIPF